MEFRNSQSGSGARRYPEPTRPQTTSDGASTPAAKISELGGSVGRSPKMLIMAVVVVLVVILVALCGWFAWSNMNGGDAGVKTGQYQAVFLTNGQVYFGKLRDVNSGYVQLSNIYYLQVQQSVQPDSKSSSNQSQSVSLAKLGSELHGPEDQMFISRQQVLFWENLKNDGKVVQAINTYNNQQKK